MAKKSLEVIPYRPCPSFFDNVIRHRTYDINLSRLDRIRILFGYNILFECDSEDGTMAYMNIRVTLSNYAKKVPRFLVRWFRSKGKSYSAELSDSKSMSKLLGHKVRDKITGFTGTVTGYVQYLTGCNQGLVVGESKDGKAAESAWFDEQRLETLKDAPIKLDNGKTPGCDAPAPIR